MCPLQTLVLCDQLNLRNGTAGSCGEETDGAEVTRTFTFDTDTTSASTFDNFINYLAVNNGISESLNSTLRTYFCCTPVSP